jgi:hypothetical protein
MATTAFLSVPTDPSERGHVLRDAFQCIRILAANNKREHRVAEEEGQYGRRMNNVRLLLAWLVQFPMTPEFNGRYKVALHLGLLTDPEIPFPRDVQDRAKALLDEWTQDNWGADAVGDDDDDDDGDDDDADTQHNQVQIANDGSLPIISYSVPNPQNPLFGQGGMMHGILITRNKKGGRNYKLDPRIVPKSGKVYGDNGFTPGDWFPLQIVALQRGAHSARIAGIAGSKSHKNTNPNAPSESSKDTLALKMSFITRRPVRVLRSGGSTTTKNRSSWSPTCGLRYDGFYQVVEELRSRNKNGTYLIIFIVNQ